MLDPSIGTAGSEVFYLRPLFFLKIKCNFGLWSSSFDPFSFWPSLRCLLLELQSSLSFFDRSHLFLFLRCHCDVGYTLGVFDFAGNIETVCAVSFIRRPDIRSNTPSSQDPRALSVTKTVESKSSWTFDAWKSKLGPFSQISNKLLTAWDFTVFGSLPIRCKCYLPSFLVGAFLEKSARLLQWVVFFFFLFFSVDNLTLSGPLFLQFLQFSKSYNYYLAKLKYWRKSSFYII